MTRGKNSRNCGDGTPCSGDCAPFRGLRGRGADGSTDSPGPLRAPSLRNPSGLRECEWKKGVSRKSSPPGMRTILVSTNASEIPTPPRFRFTGRVRGISALSRAGASPIGPYDRTEIPLQRLPSMNRKRFFPLALLWRKSKKGGTQLDRGPPSHGRKGEKTVTEEIKTRTQTLRSPEVLVLYRKRADGASLRSGRDAARRAFDTAT
jgi:hypothetical protein